MLHLGSRQVAALQSWNFSEPHETVIISNHTLWTQDHRMQCEGCEIIWEWCFVKICSQFLCILEKFLNCLFSLLVRQNFQYMEIQRVRKKRDHLANLTKIFFQPVIEFIIFPSACSVCHHYVDTGPGAGNLFSVK